MQVRRKQIRVISTGGTFEKVYHPIVESVKFDGTSAVPELLRVAGLPHIPLTILMQKDSLDMDDEHRAEILDAVDTCVEQGVVVVHGTSKMVQSAQYVAQAGIRKCVVFAGALVPVRVNSAEGAFNLGGAIVASQVLDLGVYIVMDGRILDPETADKDPTTGLFSGEAP